MSLRVFRIEFDRPGAIFSPGQEVSGKIILELSKEKVFRGISLHAIGEARVRWTESETASTTDHNGRRRTHTTTICYQNREEYFRFRQNIVGAHMSDSRITIPSGVHVYPFGFLLPQNIPSSFENKYGHIRYTLKAVIDRPWKFDHECKVAFTVVSSLDLNYCRDQCLGIDDETTNEFHVCCCNEGSMKMNIKIPTCGFVPGQTITTMLEYTNLSNSVTITSITIKLVQRLSFYASTPSHKVKNISNDIKSSKDFGPFTKNGLTTSQLRIPAIPPSNLQYCSIIELKYCLVVVIHVTGIYSKITRSYPILIGTVPLYQPTAPPFEYTNVGQSAPPYPMNSSGIVPNVANPDHPSTSSTNWNIPPPSYEECISGGQNIRDHDESNFVFGGNESFVPRYPVFNYPSPTVQEPDKSKSHF